MHEEIATLVIILVGLLMEILQQFSVIVSIIMYFVSAIVIIIMYFVSVINK